VTIDDLAKLVRDLAQSAALGAVVVVPLAGWLGKVWAARILEKDRLRYGSELEALKTQFKLRADRELEGDKQAFQSELEKLKAELLRALEHTRTESTKHVLVHRLQFEKEFTVYTELWAALVELRRATLALRPVMDRYDPNEPEAERKERRMTPFVDAYNALLNINDKHEPFIAERIHRICNDLLGLARGESLSYIELSAKDDSRRYWKESEQNAKALVEKINAICGAIRDRIGNMTVTSS